MHQGREVGLGTHQAKESPSQSRDLGDTLMNKTHGFYPSWNRLLQKVT